MSSTEPTIVGTFLVGERTVGYSHTGPAWIVSVRLDGVELDLADVLADVTVRHGRDDVLGSPQASTASVALWPVDRGFTRGFRVGVLLELAAVGEAGAWPLFTGYVSDAELDDTTLSIVAAGVLANANRVELAIGSWAEEAWSARAARLFASTPFDYVVEPDPDFDPVLYPPVNLDTGTELFETYSQSLASAVGAALFDTPDGRLAAQALGSRAGDVVHELDPALVAWAPKWTQTLDVANVIAVQYGSDDASVELVDVDEASVELFGRRSTAIESTRIKLAGDAGTRARTALDRRAYPRWEIRDLLYLAPIPNLAVGDRVLLTDLPASAPLEYWTPVVEGWTHTISGPDWTLELALSDPLASGLALTWEELPAGLAWQDVPPLEWIEADELGNFYPDLEA